LSTTIATRVRERRSDVIRFFSIDEVDLDP